MPNFTPALIVLISFYSLAIFFFADGVRRNNKARQLPKLDSEKVAQIVREAVGELPEPETVSPEKKLTSFEELKYIVVLCISFTLIYLALFYLIGIGVRVIWPTLKDPQKVFIDTSASLFIPLVTGWLLLSYLIHWIITRPSQGEFSYQTKILLSMLRFAQWLIIAPTSVAMLIIVEITFGWAMAFVVYLVYFFLIVVFWRLLGHTALQFPQYWVNSALEKGEYSEALRRVEHLETKYSRDASALYNRGTILLFAGQYAEAEKLLRESLQQAQKTNRFAPEMLINLGYAFLRQERYEEATRALQGASKLNPKNGHAYSGLAQVYLFQGIEPQQALDLVIHFMKIMPKRQVKDKSTWSVIVGDEAWALALLGRYADSREALRQAFELANKSFKPGLASLRLKEGKIFQIQGDLSRATQSFHRAIQLDPVGAYGQLARQALEQLASNTKV